MTELEGATATKYVEATGTFRDAPSPKLFIAGGITGCEDWQQRLSRKLYTVGFPGTILNPRREEFDVNDPDAADAQISWEFEALAVADIVSFWFSSETIQPIVLYELGRWLHSDKFVVVGCHPDYSRLQDVIIQTKLARPGLMTYGSLNAMVDAIMSAVASEPAHSDTLGKMGRHDRPI